MISNKGLKRMNANLYALFRSRFPKDPNNLFIETRDGDTVTYGELDEGSGRISKLLEKLGVAKGERVLAQIDKSPQAIMLYLACLRVGAIYIPLNTNYTIPEVEYFLQDSRPHVIVCRPQSKSALEPMSKRADVSHLLTLDEQGKGSLIDRSAEATSNFSVENVQADDLAAILYTSGTTGRPKGAMISHGNLASNALNLHRIWGWGKSDILLHALPIFHVHGLFVGVHCVLLNGSPMLFLPRFEVENVLEWLPRATVMMGVPTFYTRLLKHPGLNRELCRNTRLFISGSAPLQKETFLSFERRTGHRILERYGMTEAGMITSNPLEGDRLPETVGYPLPDVEVRLADNNGNVLDRSECGVLEIRGPNLFRGYWNKSNETIDAFRDDGFFITGDIGQITDDGRVSIVGRSKDLIISGGYNVYPKEIENHINEIEGVQESAVIGVNHLDFGEGVIAVVIKDGTIELSALAILEILKGLLANFKLPKRIFFIDELPRNTMGKVQKNQLRDLYADTFQHT